MYPLGEEYAVLASVDTAALPSPIPLEEQARAQRPHPLLAAFLHQREAQEFVQVYLDAHFYSLSPQASTRSPAAATAPLPDSHRESVSPLLVAVDGELAAPASYATLTPLHRYICPASHPNTHSLPPNLRYQPPVVLLYILERLLQLLRLRQDLLRMPVSK
ncbi:uncharacterized protein SCHCODRAFT_01344645 [Schizophyllum commune H4-8]|nr:uncharacterized protein SCHCODRAFT_01344645 [Schizophyllum commune H4-8]KAI5900652.1 hypothetical protein SCHCODRAFT_01344645 [Schizophyllum commune H4-8]